MMKSTEILSAARAAKLSGSTRFCMGAAWREVIYLGDKRIRMIGLEHEETYLHFWILELSYAQLIEISVILWRNIIFTCVLRRICFRYRPNLFTADTCIKRPSLFYCYLQLFHIRSLTNGSPCYNNSTCCRRTRGRRLRSGRRRTGNHSTTCSMWCDK